MIRTVFATWLWSIGDALYIQCEQDLLVHVRERLPLRTPTAEEGDLMLPLRNTASTALISDPVIAAAAAALAQVELDHHQ